MQAKFQAVGRRFNAESQRRHAREMGDLHRKIKLKQEAMAALPTEVGCVGCRGSLGVGVSGFGVCY